MVWEWFCTARSKNMPVTGRLIQEKALMFSLELGHDDFSASNGWLDAFKRRKNISGAVLSGESADVKEEVVADWTRRLQDICKGYKLDGIFSADKTRLFHRTLPNRLLVVKGDACKVAGDRQIGEA